MAKRERAHKAQPNRQRRRPYETEDQRGITESADALLNAVEDSSLEAQAARLGASRLQGAQRLKLAAQIGQVQGNYHLQRLAIQLQRGHGPRGANPGGQGPGRIQNAGERPYDVHGATLDGLVDQLKRFDGFAAQTSAPLGLKSRVRPQRLPDGTYQVRVRWAINGATVQLPRWVNYDQACPAAQQEWDRFLFQTRQHEQEAHVNAARDFVAQLGEEDIVIAGATVADAQKNLETKQQDLGARLQAIHDGCTHGTDSGALLHPDNGQCQ